MCPAGSSRPSRAGSISRKKQGTRQASPARIKPRPKPAIATPSRLPPVCHPVPLAPLPPSNARDCAGLGQGVPSDHAKPGASRPVASEAPLWGEAAWLHVYMGAQTFAPKTICPSEARTAPPGGLGYMGSGAPCQRAPRAVPRRSTGIPDSHAPLTTFMETRRASRRPPEGPAAVGGEDLLPGWHFNSVALEGETPPL